MKKSAYIIISLFLFLISCITNPESVKESDFIKEKIFILPNYRAEDIYRLTKMWFADEFRSANEIIQYDNKQDMVIISKIIISHKRKMNGIDIWGDLRSTLTIQIKDDKVKLSYSNIELTDFAYQGIWKEFDLKNINDEIENISQNYLTYIKNKNIKSN